MYDFTKIDFGYLSAESERSESQNLILKGQLDYNNSVKEALEGNKWLFLGYKGQENLLWESVSI